jgi:hypothetical protein
MDALVEHLAGKAFERRQKALVFVRRIASVKELQRKLEDRYDDLLIARLRADLAPALHDGLEAQFEEYGERRRTERRFVAGGEQPRQEDAEEEEAPGATERDTGGVDSFFAWFFRGEGPSSVLSGATVQRRLNDASGALATFFEDNHVAQVLGVPPEGCWSALQSRTGMTATDLGRELRRRAARSPYLGGAERIQRRNRFEAFQHAAIALLAERGELAARAKIALTESYGKPFSGTAAPGTLPDAAAWLTIRTFFTELRRRQGLRDRLWPEPRQQDNRDAYREQELRRELLAVMCRLGHPLVDLFAIVANRAGSLKAGLRERDEEGDLDVIEGFLDRLAAQLVAPVGLNSFCELAEAAAHFDLILSVNDPTVRDAPLNQARTRFAQLLRNQQPVGGMFGQVNERIVKQFRMPGYPLVLITTDLMQQGEDLHPFCSSVYHYGISWMPSSMEQRTGRIDRLSSETERRLTGLERDPAPDELLQVYYPHLQETVEVYQVDRVLERLDRHIELMHENRQDDRESAKTIDVASAVVRGLRRHQPWRHELRSAFPVPERLLFTDRPARPLAADPSYGRAILDRFATLLPGLFNEEQVRWEPHAAGNAWAGTFVLGRRIQPFVLLLRSVAGRAAVRCVSPVGFLPDEYDPAVLEAFLIGRNARIGLVYSEKQQCYDLTAEGDVLLGDPASDTPRIRRLVLDVVRAADQMERTICDNDQSLEDVRDDLEEEAHHAR